MTQLPWQNTMTEQAGLSDLSDAEIIAESLREPVVFAEIFTRHHLAVYRYAVRRSGLDTGSELASETFLRAFDNRHRFDVSHASARPWLFGIVANLVRMEARRRSRAARAYRNRVLLDPPPEDFDIGVAWRIDAEREVASLQQDLTELPHQDREVLLLAALGELTNQGVGEALGIPVGTVKSSLHRSRRELREVQRQRRDDLKGGDGCE